MTIGWILLGVGAILEITAFVFSAKLLQKKEEGLDRRQKQMEESNGT
jgi:hypothetical protein